MNFSPVTSMIDIAVCKWESGLLRRIYEQQITAETDTLKQLSMLFDVSINTLLGTPRKLVCQCCGMPLEDSLISREPDGTWNEDYCKWCHADGKFAYDSMEALIDFCAGHMATESFPPEQVRAYMSGLLPTLKHWKGNE